MFHRHMVFCHVFSDSSTAIICERVDLPKEGARVLYLIVFRELMRITKLVDSPFLKCWWDTVTCNSLFYARIELGLTAIEGHLALWRNGVHHRDVSASNCTTTRGAMLSAS